MFGNSRPLVLEMGCGRGDFTLQLGRMFPDCNHIGFDIKGARIWKGASAALEEQLTNVAFVRQQGEFLADIFGHGEIDHIWIPFPTPFLYKPSKMLIAPNFLQRYRYLLKKNGTLHLKTDVGTIYRYALETWNLCGFRIVQQCDDLDSVPETSPILAIKTQFEEASLKRGCTIKYLRAVPAGPGTVDAPSENQRRCGGHTTTVSSALPREFIRSPWKRQLPE